VHIDWATLAAVAVVAAGAALTVVMLVAFALVGLSLRSEPISSERQVGQVDRPSGWGAGSRPTLGMVIAGLCLLAAGLIVC
jgi:hypothetical protein